LIVWFGHVPEIVTFVPATKDGVAVPVPPEATAKIEDNPAAVPVVFWFSVGNVQFTKLPDDGVPNAPPLDSLSLKVFQFVDVRYPFVVEVAADMLIVGVVVPLVTETGAVPETEVTVPPGLDELIVWLGHVPVMVTLVPATKAGVVVPVPPLATGKVPVT
jgi:hypothetical protein